MKLNRFLTNLRQKPFIWGETDCALVLADWATEMLGCHNPATHLRDTYNTKLECARVVQHADGLFNLIGGICERTGLNTTETPQRNDIGIIGTEGRIHRQWGAIYSGKFWMVKTETGLSAIRIAPLAAWRVE